MTRTKTLLLLFVGMALFETSIRADFKTERRLALEPGGTFTLDSDVGEITLTGDSASGVVVNLTSDRDDFDDLFDLQFEETAGRVAVTVKRRGRWLKSFWTGEWFHNDTHFAIRVPARTTVNLNTSGGAIEVSRLTGRLTMHTSGGSLRLDDIEGPVDGKTSGGSIRMRSVRGDAAVNTSGGGIDIVDVRGGLKATTSGGGIDIDGVSGDVYASTSGGGVRIREAGGRVDARSSGGPVTVRFAAGNNRGGELSSSGGGVRTELDPSVALTIDASTSGGSVESELPLLARGVVQNGGADWPSAPFRKPTTSLRGDLNGGGALLRLRTSGGGVRILGARASASR
jgi:hypothetical protein